MSARCSPSYATLISDRYTGELQYVPITQTKPACCYWGIEQSISYGGKEIMSRCAGIADTFVLFQLYIIVISMST